MQGFQSAGQWPPATRRLRVGAGLLLALAVWGCQAQPQPAAAADAAEAALLARIRAEVGDARCSGDAQCRSLPIGAKACGGPASWQAWSTQKGQADKLQGWSAELAALQRQRQQASGMVSNCAIEPEPVAACQAGRCVLKKSNLQAR